MRIAVCAKDEGLNSLVSDRFGRSEKFVIFDTTNQEYITIENSAKNESGGAGGSAVRLLDKNKVDIILVPELGPKAMDAINAYELKAYSFGDSITVEEAINGFSDEKLERILTNTNDGHRGLRRV
ncbi:NifB/NifX family molybdenum-iron cluster-binding protein [Mycoplasmatota bacterium zrk1]